MGSPSAIRVEGLKVAYGVRGGFFRRGLSSVRAVDGVSFEVAPGEVLGLVGESGCGKSSLGRALLRLVPVTAGSVQIDGLDFLALRGEALRRARPRLQMVFQDPYGSLDPRMTVFDTLAEPVQAHEALTSGRVAEQVYNALEMVGLTRAAARRYPHEFSGGQRQRVAIARALILRPLALVADEPVSSLDVSVQAQVLNLMKTLRRQLNLSMLFISHNLAVVRYVSDRIAVMYLGKIVEIGPREAIYSRPRHPYTEALVSAVPIPDPRRERGRVHIKVTGEPPSPIDPPRGCAFQSRCPLATERCRLEAPVLESLGADGHAVACFERGPGKV